VATETGCDSGGAAIQEVVTVTGLSIPMTVRSLGAPSCLIVEDVTEGDTVNNRANILTCCESAAPPGDLCASACSLAAKVRTEPSFDSGETALRKVVTMNGRLIPVLRGVAWRGVMCPLCCVMLCCDVAWRDVV
jgi:hypothetical protein